MDWGKTSQQKVFLQHITAQALPRVAGGLPGGTKVFWVYLLGRACRGSVVPIPCPLFLGHQDHVAKRGDVSPDSPAPKIQDQASALSPREESLKQGSINKMRLAANKLQLQGRHLDNN